MIELKQLVGCVAAYENATAVFCLPTPWVAPLSYLHTIFKPAASSILNEVAEDLQIPDHWRDFLTVQNGAVLFGRALNIYGIVAPGRLLNRSDVLSLGPFNITGLNAKQEYGAPGEYLLIGNYDADGSGIYLNRHTSTVVLVDSTNRKIGMRWSTAEEWMRNEVSRLRTLFDNSGHLLGDWSMTLPHWIA